MQIDHAGFGQVGRRLKAAQHQIARTFGAYTPFHMWPLNRLFDWAKLHGVFVQITAIIASTQQAFAVFAHQTGHKGWHIIGVKRVPRLQSHAVGHQFMEGGRV